MLILKFIWISKFARIAKTIFKKKNRENSEYLKIYHIALIIKTCGISISMGTQNNRIELGM